jgi:NADH-quinone oxidoreductase subunit B
MHGILRLRSMIHNDPALGWRQRYNAEGTEEILGGVEPGDEAAVNVLGSGDTSGA